MRPRHTIQNSTLKLSSFLMFFIIVIPSVALTENFTECKESIEISASHTWVVSSKGNKIILSNSKNRYNPVTIPNIYHTDVLTVCSISEIALQLTTTDKTTTLKIIIYADNTTLALLLDEIEYLDLIKAGKVDFHYTVLADGYSYHYSEGGVNYAFHNVIVNNRKITTAASGKSRMDNIHSVSYELYSAIKKLNETFKE